MYATTCFICVSVWLHVCVQRVDNLPSPPPPTSQTHTHTWENDMIRSYSGPLRKWNVMPHLFAIYFGWPARSRNTLGGFQTPTPAPARATFDVLSGCIWTRENTCTSLFVFSIAARYYCVDTAEREIWTRKAASSEAQLFIFAAVIEVFSHKIGLLKCRFFPPRFLNARGRGVTASVRLWRPEGKRGGCALSASLMGAIWREGRGERGGGAQRPGSRGGKKRPKW